MALLSGASISLVTLRRSPTKTDSQIIAVLVKRFRSVLRSAKPTRCSPHYCCHRQAKSAVQRGTAALQPSGSSEQAPSVLIFVDLPRCTGIGGGCARAWDRRSRCQVSDGDGGGALENLLMRRHTKDATSHRTGKGGLALFLSFAAAAAERTRTEAPPILIQCPVRISAANGGGARGEQKQGHTRRDRTGQCQSYIRENSSI